VTVGDKMKVCGKCGWYLPNLPSNHACRPDLGADANKLAVLLGSLDVSSTKLGYGDGNVTFKLSDRVSITFSCEGQGRFSIEHVFWHQPIDMGVAKKIIESLTACARAKISCVCGGSYDEHFFVPGPRACQHCATCEKYQEEF
jgi:hypothetical protein